MRIIDGKLYRRADSIPMRFHNAIINRVKALATMNITERRKPQDGRLGVSINNCEVSLACPGPDALRRELRRPRSRQVQR